MVSPGLGGKFFEICIYKEQRYCVIVHQCCFLHEALYRLFPRTETDRVVNRVF